MPILSNLNCRLGYNTFYLDTWGENVENRYEYLAKVKLKTITFLIDWFPFREKFRLSTGIIVNKNIGELKITPTVTYEIGGKTYTSADFGDLSGILSFDKHVPYFGIGLCNAVREGKILGFVFDIGVVYQNSPHVKFEAEGMITPSVDQDKDIEQKLSGWKAYGVISLGLTIKLF